MIGIFIEFLINIVFLGATLYIHRLSIEYKDISGDRGKVISILCFGMIIVAIVPFLENILVIFTPFPDEVITETIKLVRLCTMVTALMNAIFTGLED